MDTVRSLYIDSANAKERNGSYVYDLVGGIAVPEGSRVFIDNVSFTNTFTEEVSEENQYAYLQTEKVLRGRGATAHRNGSFTYHTFAHPCLASSHERIEKK